MAATAIGGGVGGTKEEIWGTLSGALIAIGILFGRSQVGADWTEASDLAAGLREKFLQAYGTNRCHKLLEHFGPQKNMNRCKQLSGETAGLLAEMLEQCALP